MPFASLFEVSGGTPNLIYDRRSTALEILVAGVAFFARVNGFGYVSRFPCWLC